MRVDIDASVTTGRVLVHPPQLRPIAVGGTWVVEIDADGDETGAYTIGLSSP